VVQILVELWCALSVLVHIRRLLWTKLCYDLFLLRNTSVYICPVSSLLHCILATETKRNPVCRNPVLRATPIAVSLERSHVISHPESLARLTPAAASSFSYEQICDFVDIGNFSVHQPTMSDLIEEPFFKGSTGRNTRGVLRLTILCLIAAAAIASRLFSVIRKCASYPDRILESSLPEIQISLHQRILCIQNAS
jgi:hypothetical protein